MSVTQIDIDDEALSEAMRLMGTTTKKDTVEYRAPGVRGAAQAPGSGRKAGRARRSW